LGGVVLLGGCWVLLVWALDWWCFGVVWVLVRWCCLSLAPKFVGAEKQRGRHAGRLCFSCSPTSRRQGEGARQIGGAAETALFAHACGRSERHPSPASPALMDSSLCSRHVVAGWRGEVGLKARRIWGRILASLRDFSRRAPLRSVGRDKCRGFLLSDVLRKGTSSDASDSSKQWARMPQKVSFATWYSPNVKGRFSFLEITFSI
jgi:hypothetical protein